MLTLMVIFWVSLGLLVYSYVLYPLLLIVVRSFRKEHPQHAESGSVADDRQTQVPSISVVIAAFNEERVLRQKIENLAQTVYPSDRIEFLVGSDGSDDRTVQILQAEEGKSLRPFCFTERRGKASVLNDLVRQATGEIIVFSDANTFYEPSTIQWLSVGFQDPSVGGVVGELSLKAKSATLAVQAESFYWGYENSIKRLESELATTLGGTGPLYAIRRLLYVPLPADKVVMDDFLIPLSVVAQGYRIVYEPRARAYEETSETVAQEFRRKTRIAVGNYHGISSFYRLLHPRFGFAAFALWSHKILRWMGWLLVPLVVATSGFLAYASTLFAFVCLLEALLLMLVAVGAAAERLRVRIGLLGVPFHFAAMNLALAVGFFLFLFGRQKPAWKIVRHQDTGSEHPAQRL
jgi:poly-beta-1,6-N-acetyl-D-glucosamine synthase